MTDVELATLRDCLRPKLDPTSSLVVEEHSAFFLFNGYGNEDLTLPLELKGIYS